MHPSFTLTDFLKQALAEDIGTGDVTSNATIPAELQARYVMHAREEMVVAGLIYMAPLFALFDAKVKVILAVEEGAKAAPGAMLATLEGSARSLLGGERTALNLLQQLSGVATLTRRYVDAVAGTGAVILDTRKTIPGWRELQKYAVRCGGGQNHRMGLYDAILIKDNHIAAAGGVRVAIEAARAAAPSSMTIEVECDTLPQLEEALAVGCDSVLLDNMDNAQLRTGVARVRAHNATSGQAVKTEASGNVNLQTVRGIAETGVDYVSVGKLTHSAPAVDIGLDAA